VSNFCLYYIMYVKVVDKETIYCMSTNMQKKKKNRNKTVIKQKLK